MQATFEEKNRIGDAAIAMMQAYCTLRIAEDRLNHIGNLAGQLLKLNLFDNGQTAGGDDVRKIVLSPYVESFKDAQMEFFNSLGVGLDNKEFWEWCDKHNKERIAANTDSNGILQKEASGSNVSYCPRPHNT